MWEVSNETMEQLKEIQPLLYNLIRVENFEKDKRYISKEKRYEVIKRQKWKCNQCYCTLRYSGESKWEGEVAHIDHIHPYSKKENYVNGTENINEVSNLQALCPKCNLSKSNKEIH